MYTCMYVCIYIYIYIYMYIYIYIYTHIRSNGFVTRSHASLSLSCGSILCFYVYSDFNISMYFQESNTIFMIFNIYIQFQTNTLNM